MSTKLAGKGKDALELPVLVILLAGVIECWLNVHEVWEAERRGGVEKGSGREKGKKEGGLERG